VSVQIVVLNDNLCPVSIGKVQFVVIRYRKLLQKEMVLQILEEVLVKSNKLCSANVLYIMNLKSRVACRPAFIEPTLNIKRELFCLCNPIVILRSKE
jgi:hypothetical protein